MDKGDYQWALELSSHVFLADPNNTKAKDIRTRAILGKAQEQV